MFDLKAENGEERILVQRIEEYLAGDENLFLPNISGSHKKTMRMISLAVHTLNQGIDSEVQRVKEENDVTCQEGCDACCYIVIPASIPEAILIQSFLDQNPDKKETFQTNYIQWRKKINLQKLLGAMSAGYEAGDLEKQGALEKLRTVYGYIACPFLEESLCSIYTVRPISCRQYMTEHNASLCKTGATVRLEDSKLDEIAYDTGRNLITQLCSSLDMLAMVDQPVPSFVHELITDPKGGKKYLQACATDCNRQVYRRRGM